jgi:predicted NAD/FAD-binding protein
MTAPEGPLPRGQRVAVVGTGIAGLVAASRLADDHDLVVFEADGRIGGHTHTVPVQADDEEHAVDTGFIVYNERNYPNFTKLLGQLDVRTQPTSMSFSVRCDRSGLEYNGTSINTLFAQRRNLLRPRFHRMIRDILRFHRDAPSLLEDDGGITVGEYVDRHRYHEAFTREYLLPMGAALWSCPMGTFESFPIRFVVDFFRNHGMLQVADRPEWRVITGGSHRYVERLVAPFRDRIRLCTPVRGIRRFAAGVDVSTDAGTERFDHVILACHSDQALAMLADPTLTEREILGAIPYQPNDVALHTDTAVLPRTRRAWASWNYRMPRGEVSAATVTYNMNMLQGLRASRTFCVSLNQSDVVDERVHGRFVYAHPVFTLERERVIARHDELIATNRTSYCGAYWGYGFHEDGVRSALAVTAAFGKAL